MVRLSSRALLLGAALLLPLSACDETSALTEGTVEQQVINARIARQGGDYDAAVRILEQAYAASPSHPAVRVEYGVTVLERNQIDLLDLDRIAQYLSSVTGGKTVARTPVLPASARGVVCTYENDPDATPFSPTDYADFPTLQANRAALQQALTLLDPVIPDALQSFDLCTSIVDGPDGRPMLRYETQAALDELRALGLSDTEISAALATNALARFLNAFLFLTDDLPQQTAWYRVDGGTSIGVCAEDPDALADQAQEAIQDMGEALFSIDLRARTFGTTSTSQELVDLVLQSYEDVRDGVADYCGQ